MRLHILDEGHTAEQKQRFQQMEARGGRVGDMTKLLAYRPEFFGTAFSALVDEALHQPSTTWTQGERELFAAFVSRLNHCVY
jgi:hypothetical protein